MKLAPKFSILFLLTAIVPTAIVGYLAYENSRRTIIRETIEHLTSINIHKSNELKRWVEAIQGSLEELGQRPLIRLYTESLMEHEAQGRPYQKAKEGLLEDHLKPRLKYGNFLELFLICPKHGLTLVSTDERQEGKYNNNQPYYLEGKSRTHIQHVYYSPGLEQPTMTLSTPIKDKQGNLLGVLAGRLDLGELSKIIEQRPVKSRTEDTYLVNAFNFFVTESRFSKGYALKKAVHTEGVEAGLSGKNGVGFYQDYRGNSVIGVYKWLPEFKMVILTEIDQGEAFAPVVHLAWVIAGIALIIFLAAGLLALFFARTITRPIRRLAAGAEEIGKGNLDFRVGTAAKDEIGQLSMVLDQMTENLKIITVSRDDLLEEMEKRGLAEESLRAASARQEALLSAVPDIIMEVDVNKVYTWANQPGLEFFGQDVVGKEAAFFFEGDQDTYQSVKPLFNGNEDVIYVESWQRRKDGQKRLLAWWCRVLKDNEGNVTGALSSARDISEQKLAEEALKESRQKFYDTVKYLDEGYYSVTPDGFLLEHNLAFNRILGFEIDQDLKGIQLPEFWRNSDDRKEYLAELINKGFVKNYLINTKTVRGEPIVIIANSHIVKDENGRPERIDGTFTDFTEQRRAEEALRASEERFRIAAETANDVVYEWDLKQSLQWLGKIDEILGYGPGEFPRTLDGWAASLHPEDMTRVMAEVQAHLDGRAPYAAEYRVRRKDGVYRWWSARGATARTPDGKPVRWIGSITDITERKQAEETLLQEKTFTDKLLNAPPDTIFLFSPDTGKPIRWNERFTEVSGYHNEEIASMKAPDDFYDADDLKEAKESIAKIFAEGQGVVELSLVTKLGMHIPFEYAATVVETLDGRTLLLSIGRDITERKRAEEALRQKDQELEKRNEELTRFIYAVSHDLKSPLVTIKTFLGYLEQDAQNKNEERMDQDLTYIRTAAEKMSQLLDELLDLSRIGRMIHPSVETPLQGIVQEALDLVAGQIVERGVQVQVSEEPVLLVGDRPRLVEVFQNLVDNSVKFMGDQPNPRVEIGVEEAGGDLVLFVRDNGIGIDSRYQPKLFGLFEKLDPRTEGAGIGLALVQRIVEVHGGKIWVESEGLGKGACFRFTLAHTKRQSI